MIGELLDWMLGEWVERVLIACWRLEIADVSGRVGYVDLLIVWECPPRDGCIYSSACCICTSVKVQINGDEPELWQINAIYEVRG